MDLDLSRLSLSTITPTGEELQKLNEYVGLLPYPADPKERMKAYLEFILLRLTQAIESKSEPGFFQYHNLLQNFRSLKYPLTKSIRTKLAEVYFHLCLTPSLPIGQLASAVDGFINCIGRKKLEIEDMRLPWRSIYDLLSKDIFLTRRQFEYTNLAWYLAYLAQNAQRFFHPAAIDEMLQTFIPEINAVDTDMLLASQYYLTTFLPRSHPTSYLPFLFRLWESVNSYMFDERMLDFMEKLAILHIDPSVSDPIRLNIPDDAKSAGEGRPHWPQDDLHEESQTEWAGIFKDVGIFTDHQWKLLMCKCLATMEIPLADSGSLGTGSVADSQVRFEIGTRLPKPGWRIVSLANIIVYSMAPDGVPTVPPTGTNTPHSTKEPLSAPLDFNLPQTSYLAGCKALDSLARFIASTESFFHPSNSGPFTADLTAFLKYILVGFNKRWHAEQKLDCKTPMDRRLTKKIRLELVKTFRTVVLLAMFNEDPTTVAYVQSCIGIMSLLEPGLILTPILERAIPSLEAVVETQRTIAVIKGLSAVVPAMVSRSLYYPGAKFIFPILFLLLPGIDLNDPEKTMCTTSLLVDIARHIMFGHISDSQTSGRLPALSVDVGDVSADREEPEQYTPEEQDVLLIETTATCTSWVTSFCRQIIQLLDNLPEEGSSGGAIEVQVVDAVVGCCSQICAHLSDSLFDQVLDIIYEYATSNAKSNSLRAVHQLVECLSTANPAKTMAKFLPQCFQRIREELANGASSIRTTSASSPLLSDLNLHWNLAIIRGAVHNDGQHALRYRDDILSLLRLLSEKAFSKRGYSWTGKFLSSLMLTLTHTYPLESRFVNEKEWNSDDFKANHHYHWGKTYKQAEVEISWHVPNDGEIDFAIQIFKELIEPVLAKLNLLLEPGHNIRTKMWLNDFCRHLTFVKNAFSGTPSFARESTLSKDASRREEFSDILNEIPEMLIRIEPIEAGFCLSDPLDDRYQYFHDIRFRFGDFLHRASVSLRSQGEENTVDAVQMTLQSMRVFLLDYGDMKDSYFENGDIYSSEKNAAREFEGQKEDWPRMVYVRKARFYHSARLYFNCLDRNRGPLEESLMDDIVEWSMWNYPVVRKESQSLLEAISGYYDGSRRRALPLLYTALAPGADDDRMKGALWSLCSPSLGKYAASDPVLSKDLLTKLFACHHNEKPSIQELVGMTFDICLSSFPEPSYDVYSAPNPALDEALHEMKTCIPYDTEAAALTESARSQRIKRNALAQEAIQQTITHLLEIGCKEPEPHGKYGTNVIICLRTLVQRNTSLSGSHMQFFLKMCHHHNPSQRRLAHRAIMKAARYIKMQTYCVHPFDLRPQNPLRETTQIEVSHSSTTNFLKNFKIPIIDGDNRPVYMDKPAVGWIALSGRLDLYRRPGSSSTFQPWAASCDEAIEAVRTTACSSSFWLSIATYYTEELQETDQYVSHTNISFVKSIFQLLDDAPFEALKPILEDLVLQTDQNKQRGGAELIAGLVGGSKHWPMPAQQILFSWFMGIVKIIFSQIKSDTLTLWTSWIEYMFHHRDPRRLQPIVDFLVTEFELLDFNAESSFKAVKTLNLFRGFYQELGWKFMAWQDQTLERCWPELMRSEHEEVRNLISDIVANSAKISWRTQPSIPSAEVVVRECRTLPLVDIMGIRGYFHHSRVVELAENFKLWREQRIPGPRAPQSTYDRVGVFVCRWLYQSIHDTHAISVFDYIIPLMPELFRFTELNDNDDLASRANVLLVRMCGVAPPPGVLDLILRGIFNAISHSPSWRVRLKALPLVQVFYFRQVPSLSDKNVVEILEVLCKCLDDDVVEVREMAATTLSGVLRLSPRRSVLTLKERFVQQARSSKIPKRGSPGYNQAVRRRHASVLGMDALIRSYPYTIEPWMPSLLAELAELAFEPDPISSSIQKCGRNFKKTHQDTWHEDCKRFNEEQLAALSTLVMGSSYYA